MSSEIEKPHRAFRFSLRMEADTRSDLMQSLEQLADMVARNEISYGCWGGCSSGGIYDLTIDESVTAEMYQANLKEYLEREKDGK